MSVKSLEAGDADLIIVYNSGRYRMAGRGSLAGLMPYGSANDIVLDIASEILPIVKVTPSQLACVHRIRSDKWTRSWGG